MTSSSEVIKHRILAAFLHYEFDSLFGSVTILLT